MKIEDFKNVVALNKLAAEWLKDYSDNKMGDKSAKLKKQYKDMALLKSTTDRLQENQAGEDDGCKDWKASLQKLEEEAKKVPLFAICFGNAEDALSKNGTKINQSDTVSAIKLKKMASAWFGKFGDDVADTKATYFVTAIYDQAEKIMTAPKELAEDMITIQFYGSKNRVCRKMKRTMKFIANEYAGMVNVEINQVDDEEKGMKKLGLENLPTMIFKRGKKKISKHEGELSVSALQSKLHVQMEGGNISDSSSIPSIKDMKSINKKELYSFGEFLLFYFEASWCGICKKTGPVVEDHARTYTNVKFEKVAVDGSHFHHKTFGVTHVPSLVFVRDGVVIGKHVGYINPSTLEKKMEEFAVTKKRKIGDSKDDNSSLIPTEKKVAQEAEEKE